MTSLLAFDIAQFFPSLNHYLLPLILRKVKFDPKVEKFFSNYLISRKTRYFWNDFPFYFFNVDVGVGQGSALFPILSALYLSSILHILEKQLKILKIPVSILSFIDNRLLIAQNKFLSVSNDFLFCSYRITSLLLKKFGLILEYGKTEVFHFSRVQDTFNSCSLDLSLLEGSIL